MLTLKESTLVLAKIRVHHGNAAITDLEARTFHEELRADMTAGRGLGGGEALLLGQQHGSLVRFRRCERHRAQDAQRVEASEAQIARECEARGLSADEAWMYRRQRMLGNGRSRRSSRR
mgnify:CR=1 FL=1